MYKKRAGSIKSHNKATELGEAAVSQIDEKLEI